MEYSPKNFIPVHNKILVQPGPAKMIKQKLNLPEQKTNKHKKPTHLHKVEPKEYDVKTMYTIGRVLRVGPEAFFVEGDIVIYPVGKVSQFDLLAENTGDERCPVWVDTYSIYSTASDEAKKEFDKLIDDYVEQKEELQETDSEGDE